MGRWSDCKHQVVFLYGEHRIEWQPSGEFNRAEIDTYMRQAIAHAYSKINKAARKSSNSGIWMKRRCKNKIGSESKILSQEDLKDISVEVESTELQTTIKFLTDNKVMNLISDRWFKKLVRAFCLEVALDKLWYI